ncbi:MAG TPA: ABC transporter permease, partial [Candidatus Binatus sp.]|nr:ABC transporter permease [Candidatus Binatus sp.]
MAEAPLAGLGSTRRSRRLLVAGAVLVGTLVAVAGAAPWLTPYDPDAIVVSSYRGPLPPGDGHPLGTDTLGRDVWARLAYGAQTSLFVGGLAMAISLAIGMTTGLVAGYFGGLVDAALMWVVDLVLTMPSLLLLIVLATVLPPSILTIPLVIGVIGWTTFARTVRGEVLSLRELEYIQAARALGASNARIILRHLLPGVVPGVVVLAALG